MRKTGKISSPHFSKALCVFVTLFAFPAPAWDLEDPLNVKNLAEKPSADQHPGETLCSTKLPEQPMKLHEAVNYTLCNNTSTRLSWISALSSAYSLGSAKTVYIPSLSGSASASKSFSQSESGRSVSKGTGASFGIGYLLYDFGRREYNIESATLSLKSANFNYNDALQQVTLSAISGFYRLAAAQELLRASKHAMIVTEENYKAVELRYNQGLVSIADKLQAFTSLEQSRASLESTENSLKSARASLAVLMNLRPDTLLEAETTEEDPALVEDFEMSVQEMMEMAKKLRPDLASQAASLAGSRISLESAKRADLPSVSVSTGYGFSDLDVFNNTTTRSQSIGISLSIPIFSGFSHTYNVKRAELSVQSAEISYQSREQSVMADVWGSYHDYRNNQNNLRSSKALAVSNQKLIEVASARYKEGLSNILELLAAQNAYLFTERQVVQARYDYYVSRASLIRAVGMLNLKTMSSDKPFAMQETH